jgi:apolipoprotein N-acyltransferase
VLIPFVWCGLEYFRSERYYLRFAWISPGFGFGVAPGLAPLRHLGTYGLGFVLMGIACGATVCWKRSRSQSLAVLLAGPAAVWGWGLLAAIPRETPPVSSLHVAGIQLEFPTEAEVLLRLTELTRKHPEAELLVLSEYTFTEPIPEKVKTWCKEHHRFLILGGEDPAPGGKFYNTAFVLSPAGEIVFRQCKSVPIQFFKDGLPATEQRLWESPWGKIGICICYDLSYRRVTDRLVQLGAQALVVPTMDVADWGEHQHRLHGRVAPLRAAEYGLPLFRLASSGISQAVDRAGRVRATAPCFGAGEVLSATMDFRGPGTLPVDHWLAPISTFVTAILMVWFLCTTRRAHSEKIRQSRDSDPKGEPAALT